MKTLYLFFLEKRTTKSVETRTTKSVETKEDGVRSNLRFPCEDGVVGET